MAKECVQCQLALKYLAIHVRILENTLRFTLPAPQKSEEQQLKGHCHPGFCRYFYILMVIENCIQVQFRLIIKFNIGNHLKHFTEWDRKPVEYPK